MPQFLMRFSYAPPALRELVQRQEVDPAAEASALVNSLGGKVLGYWYAFGAFDGVALIEAPGNETPAAIAIAIGGTGAVSKVETTVLVTMEQANAAIRSAASAKHLPPSNVESQ